MARKFLWTALLVLALLGVSRADDLQRGRQLWTDSSDSNPSQVPFQENILGTGLSSVDNGDGTQTISASGSGITIGSTAITSGTDTRVLFDDGGTVGEDAGLTYVKGTTTLTAGALSVTENTTLGDASGDSVTSNAATWTFPTDTAVAISGGANGLNFDSNTLSIDAANNRLGVGTVSPTQTIEISTTSPTIRFTDTNASADDYEIWVDQDRFGIANVTTGNQIVRTTDADGFQTIGKLTTEGGAELNGVVTAIAATSVTLPRPLTIGTVAYTFPAADGTNGQFLTTNGSGGLSFTTSSGSGDITSVGDVASGAAFDGTAGTTLTAAAGSGITLSAGTASANGLDANLDASNAAGAADADGGAVNLNGGTADTTGTGGALNLTAGTGGSDGAGGGITLLGGAAGGGNNSGGSISVRSGQPQGSGTSTVFLQTTSSAGASQTQATITNGSFVVGPGSGTETLSISAATPVLKLDASSGDDYEYYVASNLWYLTNVTDGLVIARTTQANEFQTVGKLVTEGGADLNGKIDASGASVFAFEQSISKTIFDPDTVQATSDAIPLFEVDAKNYPFGIAITQVKISINTNGTPAYNLEEWTSPSDGSPSTIRSLQISPSAAEQTWRDMVDNSIAAGSFVFVDLDTTALNWAIITVWFIAKTA